MISPHLRATRFVGIWCLLGVWALPLTAQASDPIPWRTDYPSARKEAEAKKLPMLVVIGSQDCVYCRKLESHTFTDPEIVALVNSKFIPLKIDATKEPEFARAMKVTVYPTSAIAGHDGKIYGFLSGYLPPDQFADNTKKALNTMPGIVPAPLPASVAIAPTPLKTIAPTQSAREMLSLAKDALQTERLGECLEWTERIQAKFADQLEAKEASLLVAKLKADPDKLLLATEQLDARNAATYYALGETWIQKGKAKEAAVCFDKVLKLAPNSKWAESATLKLTVMIREYPDLKAKLEGPR